MGIEDQMKLLKIEQDLEALVFTAAADPAMFDKINKVVEDFSWMTEKIQRQNAEVSVYQQEIEILSRGE